MSTYRMSRDWFVTIMTGVILLLFALLAVSVWLAFATAPREISGLALLLVLAVCVAITAVAYLYTPTAIVMMDDGLRIERPIGAVILSYAVVRSVQSNDEWLGTSFKRPPGGNSGFFGIWGAFSSQTLGDYSMYGTKARGAVVIRTTDGTIVVTPDERDRFTRALLSRAAAREPGPIQPPPTA